jgi:hypothetical protein
MNPISNTTAYDNPDDILEDNLFDNPDDNRDKTEVIIKIISGDYPVTKIPYYNTLIFVFWVSSALSSGLPHGLLFRIRVFVTYIALSSRFS